MNDTGKDVTGNVCQVTVIKSLRTFREATSGGQTTTVWLDITVILLVDFYLFRRDVLKDRVILKKVWPFLENVTMSNS